MARTKIMQQISGCVNSGDPRADQFLDKLLLLYSGLSKAEAIQTFANAIQRIYGDVLSDKPHNTHDRKILENIRNSKNTEERYAILDLLNVPRELKYEFAGAYELRTSG